MFWLLFHFIFYFPARNMVKIHPLFAWVRILARILHKGGRFMMNIYCFYNQSQQNNQS